jgi:DNA repair protein RecO (recombination protein O)
MRIETEAVVCALRSHGEHGAVVRLMTPQDGLQAAYVRGARGRRMRPVLMAGNLVQAQLSARTDTQLPQATIELIHSRAPLLTEPLPAAAIEWTTVLTATALPEGQPYPPL